jgi:hypothetical protein
VSDTSKVRITTHLLATLTVTGTDAPAGSLDDLLKAAGEGRVTAEVSADGYAVLSSLPAPAPDDAQRRDPGR